MRLAWILIVCCNAFTLHVASPVHKKDLKVIVETFKCCGSLSDINAVTVHTADNGGGRMNVTANVARNNGDTFVSSACGNGLMRACEACATAVLVTITLGDEIV